MRLPALHKESVADKVLSLTDIASAWAPSGQDGSVMIGMEVKRRRDMSNAL